MACYHCGQPEYPGCRIFYEYIPPPSKPMVMFEVETVSIDMTVHLCLACFEIELRRARSLRGSRTPVKRQLPKPGPKLN